MSRRILILITTGGAVVLLGAIGLFIYRVADPPRASSTPVPSKSVPGFDQVAFRVRGSGLPATAAIPKRCALLAVTTSQHNQGLMNRRDLAGYDAMIFHFPTPSTAQFYMKDTLIPLSIAWFDASGRFVSQIDMPLCPTPTLCPLYPAAGLYTDAIEVPQGQLSHLGIGPGSTLTVGGAC